MSAREWKKAEDILFDFLVDPKNPGSLIQQFKALYVEIHKSTPGVGLTDLSI
jgi:hypothetical protein